MVLFVVVVIVAVGAFMFGRNTSSLYEEAKDSYGGYASNVQTLKSKKPFPSEQNARDFEAQIDSYEAVVSALQDKMLAYLPETFEDIAPPKFIENLNAVRADVTSAFDAGGIEYPGDTFYLGFKNYTGSLPKEEATAYLDYQLSAMKALFEVVAEAKPSALLNVHRPELSVEKDKAPERKMYHSRLKSGKRNV